MLSNYCIWFLKEDIKEHIFKCDCKKERAKRMIKMSKEKITDKNK